MTRKSWILAAVAAVLTLGIWCTFRLPTILVGRHMRSVTASLATWGEEYSQINNDGDAFRAIEILQYVRGYYTVGPGYRGPRDLETTLEHQRKVSMTEIGTALEKYSGKMFGTDLGLWKEWARSKGHVFTD